jgi:hypothetical protein
VKGPTPTDQQRAEAARLVEFYQDARRAYDLLVSQLTALAVRTQALLSLSGIVITVTGFSGRQIAQSGGPGPLLITGGLTTVLLSAVVAVSGVLRVTWLSQYIDADPLETIARGIAIRDQKSRSLGVAMGLFGAGFTLYCGGIANMLLHAL